MLIEKIYKEIYVEQQKETESDDFTMSNRLTALADTPVETLDKEKLELLLCKACVIGQERGFINGFHFCIQLLLEAMVQV